MPNVKRQWTVDDVHALPDDGSRYEVIDGELYVTSAPALRHQDAILEICARLRDYLRSERVGHVYIAPADVIFSPRRAVQPDGFVVPLVNGHRPEHFDEVRKLLVAIEVLSPSTARADRVAKRKLFRDEGVDEYWIIDLDTRVIEHSTPADARVAILTDRLLWQPAGAITPFELDIAEYFAGVLDLA